MELLYFIIGTLWITVGYIAFESHRIKTDYIKLTLDIEELIREIERYTEGSSRDMDSLQTQLTSVYSRLDEDEYASISEINKGISELQLMINKMNVRFGDSNKDMEKNLTIVFSEIQQLKNNFKSLNQDPNILDR